MLDPARHSLVCGDHAVLLTPTEFRILDALMMRPGRAFTRRDLDDHPLAALLQGAMRAALSAKVRDGELKIVQTFTFADHKTKNAMNTLAKLEGGRTVLLIDNSGDRNLTLGVRNLKGVNLLPTREVTPYHLLGHKSVLISEAAVAAMKPGSVIVDLAAEAGGNCALTVPDETIVSPGGVTIVGTTNLPATMPADASRLYSRNVYALLSPWIKDGALTIDMNDDVAKGAVVTHGGKVLIGGDA